MISCDICGGLIAAEPQLVRLYKAGYDWSERVVACEDCIKDADDYEILSDRENRLRGLRRFYFWDKAFEEGLK